MAQPGRELQQELQRLTASVEAKLAKKRRMNEAAAGQRIPPFTASGRAVAIVTDRNAAVVRGWFLAVRSLFTRR